MKWGDWFGPDAFMNLAIHVSRSLLRLTMPCLDTFLPFFPSCVQGNGAFQKGLIHKCYHGKTGRVFNVTQHAVGVIVNKRVKGKILAKRYCFFSLKFVIFPNGLKCMFQSLPSPELFCLFISPFNFALNIVHNIYQSDLYVLVVFLFLFMTYYCTFTIPQ